MSRIEITLKSDLCAASEDGFSSVIDTDVSYDKYGFPIIGGRRLKGCLRTAAMLIGSDKIDEIFGISGTSKLGSLRISDAVIENYEHLKKEAARNNLTAEKVISLFSYTRASTAIKNDTAKDNSLRFTRVVKHYSPLDKNELKFYADVDISEEYKEEFADICSGLRNIGYKRNRGFGAVECHFIYEKNFPVCESDFNENGEYSYTYTICLKGNVMISGCVSDETSDYIPGTSVLGFLAGRYIDTYGKDESFEDIFLKNNVKFSNLYISDETGKEYFPAPVILGKIKGESDVFNITTYNFEDKIVKPVKSGYCSFDSDIIKPLVETIYHHSTKDDGTLYTQTSLCREQYFRGTITGKAAYIKKLKNLLESSDLRFGRSKTAQYSNCKLVKSEIELLKNEEIEIKKGTAFIALLLSDVLIPDEMGGYDISVDGLKNAIGLGNLECDKGMERKHSALRYRIIAGYNAKWNIQKPHIRTIAAGSTLIFTADKDMTLPKRKTVGAKQNEGFGQVMFCYCTDFAEKSQKKKKQVTLRQTTGILAQLIESNRKIENMRSEAIEFADRFNDTINSSQVGRYILMTKNAGDLSELNYWKGQIKTAESRDFFGKIIEDSDAEKYSDDLWREYLILILTLIKYSERGLKQ
ncbi:MAG: hypothetical protein K2J26_08580 [Ruminococcus sp.]|nr:hypothetical protein [Ruminococcus sp.]